MKWNIELRNKNKRRRNENGSIATNNQAVNVNTNHYQMKEITL